MLSSSRPERAGAAPWLVLLGLALGGFFDGILLHQILQWHHLLSLNPERMTLRAQLLWDGYFHALMYGLAVVALWQIWRRQGAQDWLAGKVIPSLLIGFGLWHVLDAVVSHWFLGIHRVKVDSPRPLLWDLGWLLVFGLAPLLLGMLWRLRAPLRRGRSSRRNGGIIPLLTLAVIAAGSGWMALLPPDTGNGLTTVVFGPHVRPGDAFNAIRNAGARVAWASPDMSVAIIAIAPERRTRLYLHGALLVGNTGPAATCASWSVRPEPVGDA